MSVDNVLASVAVKDLKAATAWYEKLLGRYFDWDDAKNAKPRVEPNPV